jgi:hypothetical protein
MCGFATQFPHVPFAGSRNLQRVTSGPLITWRSGKNTQASIRDRELLAGLQSLTADTSPTAAKYGDPSWKALYSGR